jgi:hypothetical protein
MTDPVATAEAALCAAYREELDRYTRALRIAEGLPAALADGPDGGRALQHVRGLLDEVATIEARIAPSKSVWQESGRKPGAELGMLLAQMQVVIERLAACIHAAEQQAAAQKEQLVPELDAAVRSRRMLRAYGTEP